MPGADVAPQEGKGRPGRRRLCLRCGIGILQLALQEAVLRGISIERDAGQQTDGRHQTQQQAEHQQALVPQPPGSQRQQRQDRGHTRHRSPPHRWVPGDSVARQAILQPIIGVFPLLCRLYQSASSDLPHDSTKLWRFDGDFVESICKLGRLGQKKSESPLTRKKECVDPRLCPWFGDTHTQIVCAITSLLRQWQFLVEGRTPFPFSHVRPPSNRVSGGYAPL